MAGLGGGEGGIHLWATGATYAVIGPAVDRPRRGYRGTSPRTEGAVGVTGRHGAAGPHGDSGFCDRQCLAWRYPRHAHGFSKGPTGRSIRHSINDRVSIPTVAWHGSGRGHRQAEISALAGSILFSDLRTGSRRGWPLRLQLIESPAASVQMGGSFVSVASVAHTSPCGHHRLVGGSVLRANAIPPGCPV